MQVVSAEETAMKPRADKINHKGKLYVWIFMRAAENSRNEHIFKVQSFCKQISKQIKYCVLFLYLYRINNIPWHTIKLQVMTTIVKLNIMGYCRNFPTLNAPYFLALVINHFVPKWYQMAILVKIFKTWWCDNHYCNILIVR